MHSRQGISVVEESRPGEDRGDSHEDRRKLWRPPLVGKALRSGEPVGKVFNMIALEAWLQNASRADIRKSCLVCVCVCLPPGTPNLRSSPPKTMPDEQPPTPPPPKRFPSLIMLPASAKFQLVWPHLCDVVLFPSLPRRACIRLRLCATTPLVVNIIIR